MNLYSTLIFGHCIHLSSSSFYIVEDSVSITDLCQNVLIEVRHITVAGHRSIVIILEVLFQGPKFMGNVQSSV